MKTETIKMLETMQTNLNSITTKCPNNTARHAVIEAIWKLQDAEEAFRKSMGPYAPKRPSINQEGIQ